MPHDWTFWFFVAFMTLSVGLVIFAPIYSRRRAREAAQLFANQYGFRELRGDEVVNAKQRGELELLKRGYRGKATNAWEGMYKGEIFRIFTYSYTFGMPLIAHVRFSQTVFAMEWHGLELPVFAVVPKSDLYWTFGAIKWPMVKAVPGEFSQRNGVISPAPERVKGILENGFGNFLRRLPRRYRVTIEGGGGRLVWFRKRDLIAAKDWPVVLDEVLKVAQELRTATAQTTR